MRTSLKGLAFLAALFPAFRLFRLSSGLAAAVASIPVMHSIEELVDLPPVASKLTSFFVVGTLLIVGWYVAEAVVVLAAIAIAGEVIDLIDRIREANAEKQRRPEVERLHQRFNFGAPQLAIVEDQ